MKMRATRRRRRRFASPVPQQQQPPAANVERLEDRRLMSLTAAPAYLVPTAPGVEIKPLITAGESVPETGNPAGGTYTMAGIPDGLGAFDNGDGTFTVLMNHEIRPDRGGVRDHGSKGAFVSKWVLSKATGEVLSGDDLIKQVFVYDAATKQYVQAVGTAATFNRFCSATLAEPTAFYNPKTGLGTAERIFANGEETAGGRAFAHVVWTGQSYELPGLGKYAYENVAANPLPQDKTLVIGTDDSARTFASEAPAADPSEVYLYIGRKRRTGTAVERAGLVGGRLTGIRVGLPGAYKANEDQVVNGDRFDLAELGDATAKTAAQLQADSIAGGVTQFRRVEDGEWDRTDPNVFYYTTTDQFGGRTKVWKLTFDDVRDPEAGGTIEVAIDSPPGVPGEMFDNLAVNYDGDVLVQEDPGNQAYVAKVWQKDTSAGDFVQIAEHNRRLFDPAYAGADKAFLTQDEESSGIIDVSSILGPGHYLLDVQAHFAQPDPLVEGGQLLLMNTNAAKASLKDGVLDVSGTVNDDRFGIARQGQTLTVTFDGKTLGTFSNKLIDSIRVSGYAGDDTVTLDRNVRTDVAFDGGTGVNRLLFAANGKKDRGGDDLADLIA